MLAVVRCLKERVPELAMEEPEFIVTVPDDGPKTALAPTVRAPPMLKLLDVVTVPLAAIVNPLNPRVPEFAIDAPFVIVIVPADGLKTELVPMVSAPPTLNPVDVVTVAEFAIVNALNVSVPEFAIDAPFVIVIVPADGLKIAPAPSVRAPPTLKLLDVVTVALAAIDRPLNASVPEFVIDEPLFIVIVPRVGLNVPVTAKAPPTNAVFVTAPLIDPLTFSPP